MNSDIQNSDVERAPFKEESFSDLEVIEDCHFWFEQRNKLLEWSFRKFVPEECHFLEIGCGTGFVLAGMCKAFPKIQFSALEYFEEGAAIAAKRAPTAEVRQGDARKLSEQYGEIDDGGCFDVLEHIEEDVEVIRETYKIMAPGGHFLVTVPQHSWLWSGADDEACHVRRYSRKELRDKLEDAGFEVARITSFMSSLVPLMLLTRGLKGKGNADTYRENCRASELKPGFLTNFVLGRLIAMERLWIRMGGNLPFGSSLLAVARKK